MLYNINYYYCPSRWCNNKVWIIIILLFVILSDVCTICSRRNITSVLVLPVVESFTTIPVHVHVHVSLSLTTTLRTTRRRIARQTTVPVNRIQSKHPTLLLLLLQNNDNLIILYNKSTRRRIQINRISKASSYITSISQTLNTNMNMNTITNTNMISPVTRLLVLLLSTQSDVSSTTNNTSMYNNMNDEYESENNKNNNNSSINTTPKAISTTNMKKEKPLLVQQNQKDAFTTNTELNNQQYKTQEQLLYQSQNQSQQKFSASSSTSSSNIPKHIGIVMDGNTRWSKLNNVPTIIGHAKGANTLLNTILPYLQTISTIQYITLYIFSTENWNRSSQEIKHLFVVMEQSCQQLYTTLITNNQYPTLYINIIGNINDTRIPSTLRTKLLQLQNFTYHRTRQYVNNDTDKNTIVTVSLAINYGGRQDIVQACQNIISTILQNQSLLVSSASSLSSTETDLKSSIDMTTPPPTSASSTSTGSTNDSYSYSNSTTIQIPIITEELIKSYLYTSTLPYPDLIIRSSGEYRLSNFLLWDSAYTELYISSTLWPDFTVSTINDALDWYSTRSRRFGSH